MGLENPNHETEPMRPNSYTDQRPEVESGNSNPHTTPDQKQESEPISPLEPQQPSHISAQAGNPNRKTTLIFTQNLQIIHKDTLLPNPKAVAIVSWKMRDNLQRKFPA